MTFNVTMVFADGNPREEATGLTADAACELYDRLRAEHPRTPPAILIGFDDDPERGWFDSGSLRDWLAELEEVAPCG